VKLPIIQYSKRYVWDFWYHFDPDTGLFHLFYLNADPELVPKEKHHLAATVGYGVTRDFDSIDWGSCNVFCAAPDRWDNTSIWTGDILKLKNGYLMFYTSRNKGTDDGFTQNIGIAFSNNINLKEWQPVKNFRIQPDGIIYEPRKVRGDITIHAWRDPYLFIYNNHIYMVLSAKFRGLPIRQNGCIALLQFDNWNFKNWKALPPISSPGYYSEMEVPQLFINPDGRYELVFSVGPKYDNSPSSKKKGGFYSIQSEDILDFNNHEPQLLLPFDVGLYACRIIPELGGEIIGFDHRHGGIRRSGVKTGFQYVNRNFSNINFNN
jgi:sucrose-6-phosphate hydrolase SacC (GH32 family)